jgi:hypothetical protein
MSWLLFNPDFQVFIELCNSIVESQLRYIICQNPRFNDKIHPMTNDVDNSADKVSVSMPSFLNLGALASSGSAKPQTNIPERYFSERLYASEYINDEVIPDFSLARCRVEPGVTTQLHSLSVDEWYVIESGEGQMELGSEEKYPGVLISVYITQEHRT